MLVRINKIILEHMMDYVISQLTLNKIFAIDNTKLIDLYSYLIRVKKENVV